jgi:hypothetical protein
VFAVETSLDPSVASALRLGRRAHERDAAEKLSRLRRLRRQNLRRDLPLGEKRVEQSFNEQLFARVLGYQTLLSHDALPFHLLPQNYAGGNYDDFSLGYFGGGANTVVASAELKGPDADLDAPQRGTGYGGLTPVEQAFRTARAHAACRWVLVSNFRELRVYDIRNDAQALAVAHLDRIETRDELAALCAYFDRAALLGAEGEEPDLATAIDPTHPRSPLPQRPGFMRITFRFVPSTENEIPLFRLEDAYVDAISMIHGLGGVTPLTNLFFMDQGYGEGLEIPREVRDGWLVSRVTHGNNMQSKVAVSRYCEVEVSLSLARAGGSISAEPERVGLFIGNLLECLGRGAVGKMIGARGAKIEGHLAAELSEVAGLLYEAPANARMTGRPANARATVDRIEAGDFYWAPSHGRCDDVLASVICELAIHFRDARGGVGVDHAALAGALARERILGNTHP